MMWWTGRGLMIPFVALAPFLLGAQYGRYMTAAALLFGAAMLYMLRDWFGEESSFYSVRVKYWTWIMLVFAVASLFAGPRGKGPSAPRQLQQNLPAMIGTQLRVDRAEVDQGAVHYYGAFKTSVDLDDRTKEDLKRKLAAHYCDAAKQAAPELILTATNPPRSLNDRLQSVSLSVTPVTCS